MSSKLISLLHSEWIDMTLVSFKPMFSTNKTNSLSKNCAIAKAQSVYFITSYDLFVCVAMLSFRLERFQIFRAPLVQPDVKKFLQETKQRKISELFLLVQKFIFLTGRTKKENCESTLWQENNNCRTYQNNR